MRNQPFTRSIKLLFFGKKARFVAAGLLNTVVDFAGFNIGHFVFGLKLWEANILSTTIAMLLSFIINKRLVFGDNRVTRHGQFIAFILVTAIGLWILQTSVIVGVDALLKSVSRTTAHASAAKWLVPNIAKGIATVSSAIWNYFWYDRVIFAQSPKKGKLQEWI